MFALLRHPFITVPMKFLARVAMAAVWGIALSPFDQDVKLAFGAVTAIVAGLLSYSFVSHDKVPLSASRLGLYGLVVAGEALAVGTIVLAALGGFTGQLHMYALWCCAFGGALLSFYGTTILYRDNMSKVAGSNP